MTTDTLEKTDYTQLIEDLAKKGRAAQRKLARASDAEKAAGLRAAARCR